MSLKVKEIVKDFVGQIDDFPFHNINEQVVEQLRSAWKQYPVLRFRNVTIGDREQITFSSAFGPPVFHPRQLQQGKSAEFPEILVISNKKKADGSAAGDLGDGEVTWHTDTWFVEQPPSAAILRSIELPPNGGNTYFSNMYSAYASLPEALKKRLDGLSIHHQDIYDSRGEVRLGKEKPSSDNFAHWSGVDHPIVRRHAESGKPGLYLGGDRPHQSIVGMSSQESKDLLDELWQRATEAAHVWSQEWQPGDMVMWDNRCTLHRRDPFDPTSTRLMHRTTAQGERPIPWN
ncbi:TauD/TfdA dioxygenase family protein [Advenella alkanexedens]|uniref:TauD/TfdA dioxygenase family protein n=1 Tax=Advenella alkanexedens TaxID=1481665 RepID=UPI0026772CEA|nr:TauD/TfdA family dioxygenase [Advenella alkanexedens]WKU19713.1 TauD/TfdA family dioxygenase [Advenella alkanexedens]